MNIIYPVDGLFNIGKVINIGAFLTDLRPFLSDISYEWSGLIDDLGEVDCICVGDDSVKYILYVYVDNPNFTNVETTNCIDRPESSLYKLLKLLEVTLPDELVYPVSAEFDFSHHKAPDL